MTLHAEVRIGEIDFNSPDGLDNHLNQLDLWPREEEVLVGLRVLLCQVGRREAYHLVHSLLAKELYLRYDPHRANQYLIPHNNLLGEGGFNNQDRTTLSSSLSNYKSHCTSSIDTD